MPTVTTKRIGMNFERQAKWGGLCAMGPNGSVFAIATTKDPTILEINPRNDSTSCFDINFDEEDFRDDVGEYFSGLVNGPDGWMYGIPCYDDEQILKWNPRTNKVKMFGETNRGIYTAGVLGPNGILYFFGSKTILRCDPISESTSFIRNRLQMSCGGAVLAGDGCIYIIPSNGKQVTRFDPSDESTTFIGKSLGNKINKWSGAILARDGNIYGIPSSHERIVKITVSTQTVSFVGPDLGKMISKYVGGVLGLGPYIFMTPFNAPFVLRFDTSTGTTTIVGHCLGEGGKKYCGGMLAPNGSIYLIPNKERKVLKVSWSNWLYVRTRLLVEQGRAEGKDIQSDEEDLKVIQHFITHVNDDVFRTVLDMIHGC